MNRTTFLLIVVGAGLTWASFAQTDSPTNSALKLTFVDFKDTYPQGFMKVMVQLENTSDSEIVFDQWCMNSTPNNIYLYSRPRGTNYDGNIADAEPSNNSYFTKLVIPAKGKLQTSGTFICNLKPGDYEFQVALKWTPGVEGEWKKCRITPGKIFNTRKGSF